MLPQYSSYVLSQWLLVCMSRCGCCCRHAAVVPGHDLCSRDGYAKAMKEFEDVVGLEYLKILYVTDSAGRCVNVCARACVSLRSL